MKAEFCATRSTPLMASECGEGNVVTAGMYTQAHAIRGLCTRARS